MIDGRGGLKNDLMNELNLIFKTSFEFFFKNIGFLSNMLFFRGKVIDLLMLE